MLSFDMESGQEYSEDGVDVSLIRWMLSLTPSERLRVAEDHANEMLELRALFAKSQSDA